MNLIDRLPDERLVALVRSGRDDAFAAIVRRHRPALLSLARRLLHGTGHDPEDVLQDALIRAHAALRTRDDARKLLLRPWLCTIVRNRALDELRRPVRVRGGLDDHLHLLPGAEDPADAAAREERLRAVLAAVAALPVRQRTALVLLELDGRSHREVAGVLGTSVPATKSLIHRARAELTGAMAA